MTVLYDFDGQRTVFPFLQEVQASVTILRTLMPKNAIWTKRAPHELTRASFTIFMKSQLFSCFQENFRPVSRFWEIDAQKCDLAKTCSAWPENSVLYKFNEKCTVFPSLKEFQASFTILRTLTLKNAIWPKRAATDLKRAFCRIFIKSALFFLFKRISGQCGDFEDSDGQNCVFGQNVLRVAWKERFVQFSWKAHWFSVLKRIWA